MASPSDQYDIAKIQMLLENSKGLIQACTTCHRLIEKDGGCSQVKCTHCGHYFHYTSNFLDNYDERTYNRILGRF